MNRRQCTKGLGSKQVTELTRGWEHAARIDRPLNALVTIRPFEECDPATICKIAASTRNALGVYARQHNFPFVAAWTRECNPDGTGEHFHVLMHVPRRYFADLEDKVIGWFPEPGAADVRPAHQNVTLTETGNRMSAIGYIANWTQGVPLDKARALIEGGIGMTGGASKRAQTRFRISAHGSTGLVFTSSTRGPRIPTPCPSSLPTGGLALSWSSWR